MKGSQLFLSVIGFVALAIVGLSISSKASGYIQQVTNISNPNFQSNVVSNGDSENAIRIALLLDTSSSMSGLIEQAKSQLWKIVNEFTRYEKDGCTPNLNISLYEYGNSRLSSYNGYVRQISPMTEDIDHISAELFSLTTGGGEEYCGTVMKASLNNLNWGHNLEDLNMIFIAGNESFNQGSVPYKNVCYEAKKRGITVNTIYCGHNADGINLEWLNGAQMGNGQYMCINHNDQTTYYASPYDDQINDLNKKLNSTYIPTGKKGKAKIINQQQQDANAGTYSKSNMVERAIFKSSKSYKNTDWDLVDAYKKDKSILKEKNSLPEEMQDLEEEEIEALVIEKDQERINIQNQIQELNEKRKIHIAKEKKSNTESSSNLENSIVKSIDKKAKEKNYTKK